MLAASTAVRHVDDTRRANRRSPAASTFATRDHVDALGHRLVEFQENFGHHDVETLCHRHVRERSLLSGKNSGTAVLVDSLQALTANEVETDSI